MAGPIKGTLGSLKIATNVIAEIKNWSLDFSYDLVDTTSFGDVAKESSSTIYSWSGSASGSYDITDSNGQLAAQTAWLAGTVLAMRFYTDSTHYYSGNAFVNPSFSAAVDGIVEVNYSFTGSGALSYN
jgi:hypothetical protein